RGLTPLGITSYVNDRPCAADGPNTTITVLPAGGVVGTFATHLTHWTMTTIGKRFLERTKGKDDQRVLDTRTRSVLNAVLSEKRGKALDAYLKAMGTGGQRTLAAVVLFVFASASMAQQNRLNGTVRSSTGQPLAFVNVALSGTGMGSTTDKNGRF